MEVNVAYNEDCIIGLERLDAESVDIVLTDPPYLYLKNHRLDRAFDEDRLFRSIERILKDSGFVVIFGRGESFYRWNTILSNLGFVFKEEIIWDKRYPSSPLLAISRMHETVAIFAKKTGKINHVKVPYLQSKQLNIQSIVSDINRLKSVFSSVKDFDAVANFLATGNKNNETKIINESTVTISSKTLGKANRCVSVLDAMENGLNERSIIAQVPEKYTNIHPTQKPVRLIERLLALVSKPGDTVVDPFAGSFVTGKACYEMDLNYILFEIDKKYYSDGMESFKKYKIEHKPAKYQGN